MIVTSKTRIHMDLSYIDPQSRVLNYCQKWWKQSSSSSIYTYLHIGGKMVKMWSSFGASPPARGLGEPWTWWIGSAPEQMSGCCLGAVLSWFAWWAACGGWLFFIDPSFLVNSHFDHSWAWIPACSLTAALLNCCFPSNLSTTTQGAVLKLRVASSELCTLFIWSV